MVLDPKKFDKLKKRLKGGIEKELFERLSNEAIPNIKESILNNYRILSLYKLHNKSDLKLNNFYSKLEDFLNSYDYLEVEDGSIMLRVPDITDLAKSKVEELKVLIVIAEGLVGSYVELNEKEASVISIKPTNIIQFIINNKRVYLYKYTAPLGKKLDENRLPRKFWPFKRPDNIFEEADTLVSENMDNWIKRAIEESRQSAIQEYR